MGAVLITLGSGKVGVGGADASGAVGVLVDVLDVTGGAGALVVCEEGGALGCGRESDGVERGAVGAFNEEVVVELLTGFCVASAGF